MQLGVFCMGNAACWHPFHSSALDMVRMANHTTSIAFNSLQGSLWVLLRSP
jgi:hypothetical protein